MPAAFAVTVAVGALCAASPAEARRGSRRARERLRLRAPARLLRQAHRARVFESAALLVLEKGRPLIHRGVGRAGKDAVFDLASLTKPLATMTTLMRVMQSHPGVGPRSTLGALVPELRGSSVAAVRLEQLLSHSSGLPQANTIARDTRGMPPVLAKRVARRCAAGAKRKPGGGTCYSDLNYILLDWALESVTRKPLDRLMRELVVQPLGLRQTGFVRRAGQHADKSPLSPRVVATERVDDRGRIHGQVHDRKAFNMGGVAGHAGLFSSAADVGLIVQSLLDAYNGRPSIFSQRVVRSFFDAQAQGSPWALGLRRPTPGSSAGDRMPTHALGHLGFTGTSLWIDPRADRATILLTNRVYYGRDNDRIQPLRRSLHDAVNRLFELREGRSHRRRRRRASTSE